MDSTVDIELTFQLIETTGALIFEAAARGDLKKLREIRRKIGDVTEFRKICDVYCDFSTGRTVLHRAAELGYFEICKFLIHNIEVYIDPSTYNRETPLMEAVKGGHFKVVEYLIKQGAQVTFVNSKGFTAFHYALLKGNRELMQLLLLKGANIDADSEDGTALQIAVSRGDVNAVKFLLSRGAKPHVCFLVVDCPLSCAIKSHSFECLALLLKAKADLNKYFSGFSPLSYAAKEEDTKYLKALLEAGADPNSSLIGHVKPIEDAALADNREGVEILFPLTQQLGHYPEWTVDCIMEYCNSEEAKEWRELVKSRNLETLNKAGHIAMELKQFKAAVVYFTMASHLDPSNPKWASKRSLCHAHNYRNMFAMRDAAECVRLEPHAPGPHHGDPKVAANIIKKFYSGSLCITMFPYSEQLHRAYRIVVFDYFAWLYLMSSPEEIVNCSTDDES